MVKNGDRNEIAKVVNTLLRHNIELKKDNKKLYEQDRRILDTTQNILFKELAMSLDTSYEMISKRVSSMLKVMVIVILLTIIFQNRYLPKCYYNI